MFFHHKTRRLCTTRTTCTSRQVIFRSVCLSCFHVGNIRVPECSCVGFESRFGHRARRNYNYNQVHHSSHNEYGNTAQTRRTLEVCVYGNQTDSNFVIIKLKDLQSKSKKESNLNLLTTHSPCRCP